MGIPLYVFLVMFVIFLVLFVIYSFLNFFVFFKWGFSSATAYLIFFLYVLCSVAVISGTVYFLMPIDWTQTFELEQEINFIE